MSKLFNSTPMSDPCRIGASSRVCLEFLNERIRQQLLYQDAVETAPSCVQTILRCEISNERSRLFRDHFSFGFGQPEAAEEAEEVGQEAHDSGGVAELARRGASGHVRDDAGRDQGG